MLSEIFANFAAHKFLDGAVAKTSRVILNQRIQFQRV